MRWALSLLLVLTPSLASAQVVDDFVRVGGYFALGAGGDASGEAARIAFSNELEPTIGAGLRLEGGVHELFSVGANLEVLTFESDALDAEREAVFDVDLWLRLRYLVEIDRDLWIEPYVGLPVGLSLAVLPKLDLSGDDTVWPGWNIGAMAGVTLVTSALIGFFLEAGWRFHQVFNETSTPLGDVEGQLETHQFALQIGLALFLD